MAVHISLGGSAAGDGFLIAPLMGATNDAEIALWVDAGVASVTLNASPNLANLVFSSVGPFNITTVPTVTQASIHCYRARRAPIPPFKCSRGWPSRRVSRLHPSTISR
jgi:hypothetical protein